MKILGFFLTIGGLAALIYCSAFYDTSVAVPKLNPADFGLERLPVATPDRVNNLGLMQNRQNGIIVSLATVLIGVVLLVVPAARPQPAPPVAREVGSAFTYNYFDAMPGPRTQPGDPHTQWLLDCVRADAEQRPRPPKPTAGL